MADQPDAPITSTSGSPKTSVVAASSTNTGTSNIKPSNSLKVATRQANSLKSPASTPRSPKQGSGGSPKFGPRTPVSPRSKEDMVGALKESSTGIMYPYNMWGPIGKWGYLEDVNPTWAHKKHYGGKHVSSSTFNFLRQSIHLSQHVNMSKLSIWFKTFFHVLINLMKKFTIVDKTFSWRFICWTFSCEIGMSTCENVHWLCCKTYELALMWSFMILLLVLLSWVQYTQITSVLASLLILGT